MKVRVREKRQRKIFYPGVKFTSQMASKPKPGMSSRSHMSPGTQHLCQLPIFSQAVSRELVWKWSTWDMDHSKVAVDLPAIYHSTGPSNLILKIPIRAGIWPGG